MRKRSSIWFFTLMVFVLPLTAYAILNIYEKKWEQLPVLGNDKTIEDFSLVNQDGKITDSKQWNNKIIVADFFFSHCASICPKMTANLNKVNNALTGDDQIQLVSFSVDPERDSAVQLKRYATRLHLDTRKWDFLTGSKKEIYRLARNSFMIVATDGDGGPNDFIHSEKLVLIDKQKRVRGYYDGTSDKETSQLVLDIKKLKDEN